MTPQMAPDARTIELPGPLVDTSWLAAHREEVVILDVSMAPAIYSAPPLGDETKALFLPTPHEAITGHIPSAVQVSFASLFATRTEKGVVVQHMRVGKDAFERLMRASGVGRGSAVVITGQGADVIDVAANTRLYLTLKYYGHDRVAILDGGNAKWSLEKRPMSHEPVEVSEGDFTVTKEHQEFEATLDEVQTAMRVGKPQLLDARAVDHYLGLTSSRHFVPSRAYGHIPGAKLFSAKLVADRTGPAVFYAPSDIRAAAAALGVDVQAPAITYCNAGVLCTVTWFALHELLGNKSVRAFDGSMHQWSLDPTRPIARFTMD